MNSKKIYAGFAVTVLILSLSGCSLKYQRELVSEANIPQIVFENTSIKRYADNKKNAQLESELFEQYKKSNTSFARNVSFVLFDSEQRQTASGKTTLISSDMDSEIFQLFDGLEFFDNSQNIRITGDTLKWNGKTEQLVSAKGKSITIKKDDLTVTGTDFSASGVSNTFLFSGKVSGQQILVSQTDGSSETITFSGDSMQGRVSNSKDGKKNSTILSGNAFVKTSTMEIRADSIELYGQDFKRIKARGNIKGVNSESELEFSAQELDYDQDTKIVVLSGGVELKDVKNAVTAKAQIIEYDQNTDVAVMQIDVELHQKQNVCTGAYSVYRKKEQTLELSGNASVKQEQDVFRAQSIKFNMETEEIVMDGNIRGTVTAD